MLDMQPRPIAVQVARTVVGDQIVSTAISRQWAPGDAHRCKLCPRGQCVVNRTGENCLVLVSGYVTDTEAPFYRVRHVGGRSVVLKTVG